MHRKIEIARQATDHQQLLIVFFAKIGDVGQRLDQELGYDRGDAVEMADAMSAAQPFAQPADPNQGRKPRRVDFVAGRDKSEIGARRLQHVEIGGLAARIGAEILGGRELLRVDKDRSDNAAAIAARRSNQSQMTGVQRAHRRHQANALAGSAPIGHVRSELADCPRFPHPTLSAVSAAAS